MRSAYAHNPILGAVTSENAQRLQTNITSGIKTCLAIVELAMDVKLSYLRLSERSVGYPTYIVVGVLT